MYPEEKLLDRSVFHDALRVGTMEFKDLVIESERCLIPWQIFFLNLLNLEAQLSHIETQRHDKISSKLIAKRKGLGNTTSKRIMDRLIRIQNYICENYKIPKNEFCESLVSMNDRDAVNHIVTYFEIDLNKFKNFRSKEKSFEYLIDCFESKNINISQGVLTNKILPNWQVVDNSIYKNTSGFVVKDDRIPFIFLPSEVSPDESTGRHIFTLVYLITLIGLGEFEYYLKSGFEIQNLPNRGRLGRLYNITSEFLLPSVFTDTLKNQVITEELRDKIASDYKITPTAVVVILRKRGIITSVDYDALLPSYVPPPTSKFFGAPLISTSVRKFTGKHAFNLINEGIKTGLIKNTQAQYLLFGYVNKKAFKKYRESLNI